MPSQIDVCPRLQGILPKTPQSSSIPQAYFPASCCPTPSSSFPGFFPALTPLAHYPYVSFPHAPKYVNYTTA